MKRLPKHSPYVASTWLKLFVHKLSHFKISNKKVTAQCQVETLKIPIKCKCKLLICKWMGKSTLLQKVSNLNQNLISVHQDVKASHQQCLSADRQHPGVCRHLSHLRRTIQPWHSSMAHCVWSGYRACLCWHHCSTGDIFDPKETVN